MEMFLQILGSIVLVIILVIVGGYAYIRIRLGKYADMDMEKDMTPLFVHLNEDIAPKWVEKKDAIHIEQELISLGFTASKAYDVVGIEDMELKAFLYAPYIAVMYHHPVVGVWIDIVATLESAYDYTVSNAPMGGEMDSPPHTEKYFIKEASALELFDKIKLLVGTESCKDLSLVDFREYFEEEYKKETRWKNKNGGISYEEFLRVVENDPKNYSDKEIALAFRESKRKELTRWHNGAMEEYKNQKDISQNDFYDMEYELFIVPSQTDSLAFIEYLASCYMIEDEDIEKFEKVYQEETNIPLLFETINEQLSPDLRAVKVASVDYPIDIDIYRRRDKEDLSSNY